ncbi:hypothetical protein UA32_12035 [Photobacterium angustum]|uniref:Uncharacterized protein n=1 Tax=Photobacterium angustum TaxID=661 RepID=A0ABX5GYJ9_PHOAN|nr:hypothetical protein [Photobacterium angustum]KJG37686.1 hypothetical protein UA32_12035 [Photobacterium angustum]PSX03982.1 hypothetical protein C0W27_21040 [Photobacterium angustum]
MENITLTRSSLFSENDILKRSFNILNDGQVVDVEICQIDSFHVKICELIFEVKAPKGVNLNQISTAALEHIDNLNVGWLFSKALNKLYEIDNCDRDKYHSELNSFLNEFNENNGFNPIHQQDYLYYVVVNFSKKIIATYVEGDVEIINCKTQRAFDLTLSHSKSFYNNYF